MNDKTIDNETGEVLTNDIVPIEVNSVVAAEINQAVATAKRYPRRRDKEIADEIVGRWGLASFQNPNDRARTEAAARLQCKQPYVIGAGANGGVIMHLADQATPQELRLKGSPSGKNYIGPPGPAGGEQDREIVSFDGRVLITRFTDKDAATRYGNMVYVRCAPRA